MFGATLLAPIREAIAKGLDPLTMTGATLFDDLLRADTAALAETIIPETDTPGARAAGVEDFIESMLQEWYPTEDRDRYLVGMGRLDRWCADEFGQRFATLDPHEQHRVVAAMQDGESSTFDDGGKAFFEHAKQLTVFGYYTSEIGMTVERRYLPVPGRFDGAYPYAEVGTLFTS